jgi:hypothetical protein
LSRRCSRGRRVSWLVADEHADQLRHSRCHPPPVHVVARIRQWAAQDGPDLEPELRRRADAHKAEAIKDLAALGEMEAKSLRRLLDNQRNRLAKADAEPEDRQLSFFSDAEAEQRRRDRRHWKAKLDRLATDIEHEPERVRQSYSVVADRLEIVGLVYLWPEGN